MMYTLAKAQYLIRLKGFLQSRREKRAHIDDLKGGSVDDPSPLRILPNELLSRIFVLCTGGSPLNMFHYGLEVPHQRTISQVCSRWRQVALNTPVLWSNVQVTDFVTEYARRLRLYQTWVGRAGNYPLTVSLFFLGLYPDIYKVFLDFVVPFRIQKLDITMPYHKLMCLPPLDVDEFAIVVTEIRPDEDLKVPPFMDKTRHICILDSATASEDSESYEPKLRKLCLSWHQLQSFECYSPKISLSTWLNVLRQPGTLQYLERCHLTIAGAGSGPLVGVCMLNVHWFSLTLLDVQPDIAIPLIAVPNITTLRISDDNRSSDNLYDIIKRQYKLHQLHEIRLQDAQFSLPISQILADAPMIHTLGVLGTPILDAEAREGISSGRLGHCLTTLHISSCSDNAEEWLDVIETRQRNMKSMVAQVSNWREMFTGIKSVELCNVQYAGWDYKKRVAALGALGITVELAWIKCNDI